jgi:Rrf2 family transcriptional regulator, nitric oxide-sensitive transcriptional repressor
MLLSQTTEYAMRAVLFIAARHPAQVRSAELAASLELPANYLAKTLGQLARAGLLISTRGSAGGFRLSRAPNEIRLVDVTRAFESNEPRRCLLGLGPCGHNPGCLVHKRWLPSAHMIEGFFDSTTIADLVVPGAAHDAGSFSHHDT